MARIQELEADMGVILQYSWVKAHIGIHYNELADYLAYNAAREIDGTTSPRRPVSGSTFSLVPSVL